MTESEKVHLVALLDDLVHAAISGVSAVSKYGGTLYTLHPDQKEGQFCGVFAFKDHVQITFANGAELDDPDAILEGGGKYRRHLNFKEIDSVDAKIVRRFIKASAKQKG